MMIRVGLVGEDPNDTLSIKNLLEKTYYQRVKFLPLARRICGFQLDNPKIKRSLPIEFADAKCKFIIYIRDLDAFTSEKGKLRAKIEWFKDLDSTINKKGILLLNVWELEALILSDIETFNSIYKINFKFAADPMLQKEPKELLRRITSKSKNKFKESSCPDIFKKLNISNIEKRCASFESFVKEFEERLSAL